MKKILLVVLLSLLLGVSTVFLVGNAKPEARNLIDVDLGEVIPGAKIEKTITVPNKSSKLLTIKSVTTDCSCIMQEVDRKTVLPGESAQVRVQYLTPQTRGETQHILEVKYEGKASPTTILLHGTVGAWASVEPLAIDFATVSAGESVRREVLVKVKEPWPNSQRKVELLLDHGKIVQEDVHEDGMLQRYHISFSAPQTIKNIKEYRGELVVEWDKMAGRTLRIPCSAWVMPEWIASPDEAFFGVIKKGSKARVDIEVKRARGAHLESAHPDYELVHDLGSEFRIETSLSSADSTVITIFLCVPPDAASGLRKGRVELIGANGSLLLAIPVKALVR